MFETYDTKRFGEYIKNLRISMNLSQEKVAKSTKLSTETLRKIENGFVVPRYDTLEYLSRAYKCDILNVFKSFRTSELLFDLYQHIDDIILNYDVKSISKLDVLLDDIENNLLKETFIELNDVQQITSMILGIKLFYENKFNDALLSFLSSMTISHPNFNELKYGSYNYSVFESRILLMISMCNASLKKHTFANELLLYLLDNLMDAFLSNEYIKLVTKIYFNIAYNFHSLDQLHNVIKYSSAGIKFCSTNHSLYLIHGLLYRRGIAKYMLNDSTYSQDLNSCKIILLLTESSELLDIYDRATFKHYGIHM